MNISPRDLVLKIIITREFRDEIKRDGDFSRTQEIQFERALDSRGFGLELEARESQQRARRTIAIVCTKNETKIHLKRAQKRRDLIDSKAQRHKEDGASFPNHIQHKVSTIHGQNLS